MCAVTGGLGFVGSNLTHRLVALGARVRVIDALIDSHGGDRRNLAGLPGDAVEVAEMRLCDPAVERVVDGCDYVFNLAGQVSHHASMLDPVGDLQLNAVDHAAFLQRVGAVAAGARVIYSSTRQVYGRPQTTPVDENHPTHPADVNGVAKLAGEQLHMVAHSAARLWTTALRLNNVYGPRQRLSSDELGFLPVFVRRALCGEDISLFGDGSQRRECLYVDDVVEALLVAATTDACVGKVYNVGHPMDHSLAEIAQRLVSIARSASTVVTTPWPDELARIDIGSFRSDNSRFHADAGWTARTSLDEGLAATIAFYREHPWYLS